jgi:hypothetical protein
LGQGSLELWRENPPPVSSSPDQADQQPLVLVARYEKMFPLESVFAVCRGVMYSAVAEQEGKETTAIQSFSPATGSWVPAPPLSRARWDLTLTSVGGRLYAAGIAKGGSKLVEVERFDPDTQTWEPLPPLSPPPPPSHVDDDQGSPFCHEAAEMDGRLWIVGGVQQSDTPTACFDPHTHSWTYFPSPNCKSTVEVVGFLGRLFAISRHELMCLDPITQTWSVVSSFDPVPHPQLRSISRSTVFTTATEPMVVQLLQPTATKQQSGRI